MFCQFNNNYNFCDLIVKHHAVLKKCLLCFLSQNLLHSDVQNRVMAVISLWFLNISISCMVAVPVVVLDLVVDLFTEYYVLCVCQEGNDGEWF